MNKKFVSVSKWLALIALGMCMILPLSACGRYPTVEAILPNGKVVKMFERDAKKEGLDFYSRDGSGEILKKENEYKSAAELERDDEKKDEEEETDKVFEAVDEVKEEAKEETVESGGPDIAGTWLYHATYDEDGKDIDKELLYGEKFIFTNKGECTYDHPGYHSYDESTGSVYEYDAKNGSGTYEWNGDEFIVKIYSDDELILKDKLEYINSYTLHRKTGGSYTGYFTNEFTRQ